MKESLKQPLLVFVDCGNKAIEAVGNNNDFSETIFGVRPVTIRLSSDELGWTARATLGDEAYAQFLGLCVDGMASKQGVDVAADVEWGKGVRLMMIGGSKLDPEDAAVKQMFKQLFPKAAFFAVDQWVNWSKIWERGQPRSASLQTAGNGGTPAVSDLPLETLNLGARVQNGLKRYNIETIGELVARTSGEILAIPNFGVKSLQEIEEALDERGLSLRVAS